MDRLQISLLILKEFKRIYELLLPLKSSEKLCFSDDFWGNRSELIRLNSLILEYKFRGDPLATIPTRYIDFENLSGKIDCLDILEKPLKTGTAKCYFV